MSYRVTLKTMSMTSVRPRSEYSDETLSVNNLYDRQLQKQLEQYDKNTQALKKKLAKEKANLLRSVKAAAATSNGTTLDSSSSMRPRSQSMVSTNGNGTTWAKYVSKRGSNSQQNLSTTNGSHAGVTRTSSDSSSNNDEEKKIRPRSNSTGRFRRRLSSQGQTIPKSSSSHSLSPREPTISTIQTANSYKTTVASSSADQLCIESNDKQSSHIRPRSATFGSETTYKKKTQDVNYIRRKSVEKLYGINGNPTLSQIASNPQRSKKYLRRCSYAHGDQRSVKAPFPLTAVLQPSVDNYKVRLPQIKTDLSP